MNVKHTLKLLQLNVQSLPNKINRLTLLLEEELPDIVSVAEHWCDVDNMRTMAIPGYTLISSFCRPSRKHGGSAIYAKIGLQMGDLGVSNYSVEMECEFCAAKCVIGGVRVGVISAYRPPSGSFQVFLSKISYLLQHSQSIVDCIFLCGDFNIDFLNNGCRLKPLLIDLFNCFNLNITNSEPTRVFVDRNGHMSATKVDYLLTNADLNYCKTNVVEVHIGDHRALISECIFANISEKTKTDNKVNKLCRNISTHNLRELSLLVSNTSFDAVYSSSDVNIAYNCFIDIVKYCVDKCCPLRYRSTSNCFKTGWVTAEVKMSSENLKKIYWLHMNLRTQHSFDIYREAKRQHELLLQSSKLAFHAKLISSSDNQSKVVWNIVNQESGRKSKIQTHNTTLNVGGVLISDNKLVAETFADYFSSIARTSLDNKYGHLVSLSCTSSPLHNNTFFFHPVDSYEVIDTIRSLKNKKSVGADFISVRMLKSMSEYIAEPFSNLINLSISSGCFPELLKHATVIPVHKKNDMEDVSNYRPISILGVFSKVIERIVLNRMTEYLNKYNLLTSCQHGFRSRRSTQTATTDFFEHVYESLDKGLFVAGLFFDLSRAFDCITFRFILNKLHNLGFRGVFLDWLSSFINGRVMSVKVGDCWSSSHISELGVPQGSILGPLLFILFINDLPKHLVLILVQLIIFVDDLSIAVSAETLDELKNICESLIGQFESWCRENALIINIDKTECVRFTARNPTTNPFGVYYEGESLNSKEVVKFLGVYVDDRLRWCHHVDHVCRKLSSSFYAICRIKDTLPLSSVISIYYSLAYSHISYCILVWGNSIDFDRILVNQKRIIRMIFGLHPRTSCRPVFTANDILTAPCIYIYKCLLYMNENLSRFNKLSTFHSYNTRNPDTLSIPLHRTTKYQSSISYTGIKLYNHLPSAVRAMSGRRFRMTVKSMLIKKAYYSINEYLSDKSIVE